MKLMLNLQKPHDYLILFEGIAKCPTTLKHPTSLHMWQDFKDKHQPTLYFVLESLHILLC